MAKYRVARNITRCTLVIETLDDHGFTAQLERLRARTDEQVAAKLAERGIKTTPFPDKPNGEWITYRLDGTDDVAWTWAEPA